MPTASPTNPALWNLKTGIRWLLCLIGLLSLIGIYNLTLSFPASPFLLMTGLIVTSILLFWQPQTWLLLFPLFCITINLAPWTGRFLFNEWDLFVTCIIISPLIKYGLSRQPIYWPRKLVTLFVMLVLVGLYPVDFVNFFNAPHGNPYLSNDLRLYIIKGVVASWFLSLLLLTEFTHQPIRTIRFLIFGAWLASIAAFLIVLWERQTLGILFNSNDIYYIGNSFLNFSTSYRAVGLLTDMHTGGESIDGWYLMLIPINLLGIMYFKNKVLKLLSFLALNMVFYAVLVGFTRATYAATALCILTFALLYLYQKKKQNNGSLQYPFSTLMLLSYLTLPASTYLAYSVSGFSALLSLTFALFAILAIQNFKRQLGLSYWGIAIIILITTLYINLDGLIDSQWIEPTTLNFTLATTAGLTIFIAAIGSHLTVKKVVPHIYANTVIIMLSAAVFLIFSGSRMQARMENVSTDLNTRLQHWSEVKNSSDWSYFDILLGNGTGSFPLNYLTYNPSLLNTVGSFTLSSTNLENPVLQFGSGRDLVIGQRVELQENQDYRLNINAKSQQDFEISVGFCQRNLLIFDRWETKCTGSRVKINKSEQMQTYKVSFSADKLKVPSGIFKLPTLLMLQYKKGNGIVEIGSMALYDQQNKKVNRNVDFKESLDYWFFYQDFEHLAWHIKNIYLSSFYQTGLIGCLLLFVMMFHLVQKNRGAESEHDTALLTAVSAVIIAFLTFGFFGDPLDSPRVNSFFYMLLFTAISLKKPYFNHKITKSNI